MPAPSRGFFPFHLSPRLAGRLHFIVAVVVFTLVLGSSLAAGKKPSSDPKALMELARTINGLNTLESQPWHLKVTFKAVGEKGYLLDQGIYEEVWISPTKFKRSLVGASYSLVDYGTDKGVFRLGKEKKASVALNDLHLAILNPLPAALFVTVNDARLEQRDVEGLKCNCVDLLQRTPNGSSESKPGYSYCFDTENVLREATMAAWSNTRYVLKNSMEFHGHALPGDVEIWNQGAFVMAAHLESISPLEDVDAGEFQAPADAVLHDKSNIASAVVVKEGRLTKKVQPVYPPIALAARIDGVVILNAVIGKQGRLIRVQVISGPPMLRQAAIDAVEQWEYEPYMLNGAPVEIETTINIPFTLGAY